jgi:acyl dehydratase
MGSAVRYIERYFEDYEVGERQHGGQRTVDQADINLFAGLTLDFHPAHVSRLYADKRYGGRLAHGVLTFAVVNGLLVEYNLYAVSYGYEKIRFPRPVHAGDTLTATAEVVDLRPHRRDDIGLVVKHYTGLNQDEEIVLVCDHLLAVDRRRT